MGKYKVVYISGSGRSGSTLLATLLGGQEGWINVGEASRFLFDKKLMALSIPCGCGKDVRECIFWKKIGLVENWELIENVTQLIRVRNMIPLLSGFYKSELQLYYDELSRIFNELQNLKKVDVIVDSSKNPATAAALLHHPEIELYVIHLVRNPQSVVLSWSRPKGYLKGYSPLRAAYWWYIYDFPSRILKKRAKSYVLVKYEDLVSDPQKVLKDIIKQLGLGDYKLEMKDSIKNERHDIGGNPVKFENDFRIEYHNWYDRWKKRGIIFRFATWLILLPGLMFYGYKPNKL
ncbi:MAG: sulfotransferase [Patescibacteria group bacterium]|nr:MAG: sulfotransferase [Patescibacteria group bacterium]